MSPADSARTVRSVLEDAIKEREQKLALLNHKREATWRDLCKYDTDIAALHLEIAALTDHLTQG